MVRARSVSEGSRLYPSLTLRARSGQGVEHCKGRRILGRFMSAPRRLQVSQPQCLWSFPMRSHVRLCFCLATFLLGSWAVTATETDLSDYRPVDKAIAAKIAKADA